ncbi:MAG: CRISPR-associated ring nuclease Csm6 [Xanthomonadales bacterium]|nr:CRISPR-associated ring nuclease Csm6 [Xanthomonadales bacterium]
MTEISNFHPAPGSYRRQCDFPRRLLVCVTGMAPQIVTETLYVLLKREPQFVPTELHLISTRLGAEQAALSFLEPDTDWLSRLLDEFDIPREAMCFNRENIHVVHDQNHYALEDIRNADENTAAADQITRLIADFAADENSVIHASLAGGRKTLGFYLGYAMSLFGRPQDVLSHVLVNEPFERLSNFFYPPKRGQVLYLRDGTPVHTRDAILDLAEIPFVRLALNLKTPLQTKLQDPTFSFKSAVEQAQLALEPPRLRIEIGDNRVFAGQRALSVKLSDANFVFYLLLARATQAGETIQRQRLPEDRIYALADRCGVSSLMEGNAPALDRDWFDRRKNLVKTALQNAGLPPDSAYEVHGAETNGMPSSGHYALQLPANSIEIVESAI